MIATEHRLPIALIDAMQSSATLHTTRMLLDVAKGVPVKYDSHGRMIILPEPDPRPAPAAVARKFDRDLPNEVVATLICAALTATTSEHSYHNKTAGPGVLSQPMTVAHTLSHPFSRTYELVTGDDAAASVSVWSFGAYYALAVRHVDTPDPVRQRVRIPRITSKPLMYVFSRPGGDPKIGSTEGYETYVEIFHLIAGSDRPSPTFGYSYFCWPMSEWPTARTMLAQGVPLNIVRDTL